jgi:hypothetical protein
MSLRRIAARAALAATGVLASAALMAAPSWAEPGFPNPKGGNSNQAMACHGTGWESLTNPNTGMLFTSHDQCVSVYADKLI